MHILNNMLYYIRFSVKKQVAEATLYSTPEQQLFDKYETDHHIIFGIRGISEESLKNE